MWANDHSPQPPWLGTLVDQAIEAVVAVGGDGTVVYANEAAHALLRYGAGALVGANVVDFVHSEDMGRVTANIGGLTAGARPRPGMIRLRRGDRSWHPLELSPSAVELPMPPEGPGPLMAVIMRDNALQDAHWRFVTALSQGEPFETCLRALAGGLTSEVDGVMGIAFDGEGRRQVVGDLPPELAGVTPDGGLDATAGTPWGMALRQGSPSWTAVDDLPAPLRARAEALGFGACVVVPVEDPGSGRPALLVQWPPTVAMAEILVEALARRPHQAVQVALGHRYAQRRLEHLAHHDDLSGLLGRAPFFDAVGDMARSKQPFGVCYVDLDGFKPVNDTLGHVVGDHTIMVCARRLEGLARPGDLVARLGGDEFAMARPEIGTDEVEALAAGIVETLSRPFRVGEHRLSVGASVGCVVAYPGDAPDAVVVAADTALYEAKRAGRATWRRAPSVAARSRRPSTLPFPGAASA